jgi:hypothetical protein
LFVTFYLQQTINQKTIRTLYLTRYLLSTNARKRKKIQRKKIQREKLTKLPKKKTTFYQLLIA